MGQIYKFNEVDIYAAITRYGIIERKPRARKPSPAAVDIMNVVCAFDIETSTITIPDAAGEPAYHSFMYVWQFQIDDITIVGRTWEEFQNLVLAIKTACIRIRKEKHLDELPIVIVWVHNLAYEFQYLSGIYPFNNEECFFRDVRKPIYCRMCDCLEFRCSYIQTNMSLAHLTRQLGVKEKLSGQTYDYSKVRFPWTPLTDYELEYCVTDVQSLVECMKIKMENDHDNLQTIPLTSTGYVRRDCREALKPLYLDIKEMLPAEAEYRLLRQAFRGGNTHANRKYSGKIVKDVYSYDMSSCYPAQQLTKKFPMTKWKWLDDNLDLKRINKFISLGYAVVGTYRFEGLRLKTRTTIPYLSLSKTRSYNFRLDNGRILDSEVTETTLTEIDLKIVLRQYTFDTMECLTAMVCQKHYLPEEYRQVIRRYYDNKTKLKGVKDPEQEYLYQKSKEKLNGIYGMSAQDPIHAEILYNDGEYTRSDYDSVNVDKVLHQAKFPYSWGVYTTAYARAALQDAIDIAGDQMVYCDTDSVKTKGRIDLSRLNEKRQNMAVENSAYADDPKGNRHYMGVFELEGSYVRFITCGAKRYAYETEYCKFAKSCKNGSKCCLHITVSGVSKAINEKTGFSYAVEELGRIENFKPGYWDEEMEVYTPGMIWKEAAGTMAVYNDEDNITYTDPETGNELLITKNVSIVPTTYEMSYEKDYRRLLGEIALYGEYKRESE